MGDNLDQTSNVYNFEELQSYLQQISNLNNELKNNKKPYFIEVTEGKFDDSVKESINENGQIGFIHIDNNSKAIYAKNTYFATNVGLPTGSYGEIFNDYNNNINAGDYGHVEGENNINYSKSGHVEGSFNTAGNINDINNLIYAYAHAEGLETKAIGKASHSEGWGTEAIGNCSHAEGYYTQSKGDCSHAEGVDNIANGDYSHSEGWRTEAIGEGAHSEGWGTEAIGNYSHAEGLFTIASSYYQHVQGRFNIEDTNNTYAFIIGNGYSKYNDINLIDLDIDLDEYDTNLLSESGEFVRSNALTVDWDGNLNTAGSVNGLNIININWDNNSDLNNFTTPGIYICNNGLKTNTNDNLPIDNISDYSYFGFSLNVTQATGNDNGNLHQIVGQTITISNRLGNETKQFMRSKKYSINNGVNPPEITDDKWSPWKELQGTLFLGQTDKNTIDKQIDNGLYSGVFTDNDLLPMGTTFTMLVINNYSVNSSVQMPNTARQVTQIFFVLPLANINMSNYEITLNEANQYIRTGIGNDNIDWGNIKKIGGGVGKEGTAEYSEIFNDYNNNINAGDYGHVEGENNINYSKCGHIEGSFNKAGNINNINGLIYAYAHAEGVETEAIGKASHSEGHHTKAIGDYSHAEGTENTIYAYAYRSHAEGHNNTIYAYQSHVEGKSNYIGVDGYISHVEGESNTALGELSHIEGLSNSSSSMCSHIEGTGNSNQSNYSHIEGKDNDIYLEAECSHIEGSNNIIYAYSFNSHAEGKDNIIHNNAYYSHAEGFNNRIYAYNSHAEGFNNTINITAYNSHVEGQNNNIAAYQSHIEGSHNKIEENAYNSHVEGKSNTIRIYAYNSHAEGESNFIGPYANKSHAEGFNNIISDYSQYGHIEGYNNKIYAYCSHAEGHQNIIKNASATSHIEGFNNIISEYSSISHIEGADNRIYAYSHNSHAEGVNNKIYAYQSHIEGVNNEIGVNAYNSHVEGKSNTTLGELSHIEGVNNTIYAYSYCSHVEGFGNISNGEFQHVAGKFNNLSSTSVRITGWGEDDNNRKNIETLDTNGNLWVAGDIYTGNNAYYGLSKVNGAYPQINLGKTNTSYIIEPNILYTWDEVRDLSITFGNSLKGYTNEYLFQFVSGYTPTQLSLPIAVKWQDDRFAIESNKIYQISVVNNLASVILYDYNYDYDELG